MLFDLANVVSHLSWRKDTELPIFSNHSQLDVVFIHLTFKSFFQSQNGRVYGIFQLQVIAISAQMLL